MAVVYVGMYALSWINRRMAKWLGVKGAGDVLARSVANNVTSDMGLVLLDVADTVRNHPAVMADSAGPGSDATSSPSCHGGRRRSRQPFDPRISCPEYGMRCSGEIDVTRPRWSEAPSTLVPVILSTIRNLEPNARAATIERSRREAEEMQKDLVDRLEPAPGGRRKTRKHGEDDQPAAELLRLPRVSQVPDDAPLLDSQAGHAQRGVEARRRRASSSVLTTSTTSPSRSSARRSGPGTWTPT